MYIGINNMPTKVTPYVSGMNWVVIVLICLVPMLDWTLTLIAMKGYSFDGQTVRTIQAVNAARKAQSQMECPCKRQWLLSPMKPLQTPNETNFNTKKYGAVSLRWPHIFCLYSKHI